MTESRPKGSSLLSSFKRTARLYVKSRIGMIGLFIIIFFVVLAVFAPQLGPNDPVTGFNVAAPYSIPVWATAFPQYNNISPDFYAVPVAPLASKADLSAWSMTGSNFTVGPSNAASPGLLRFLEENATGGPSTFLYLNATIRTDSAISNSYSPDSNLPYGQVFFSMTKSFHFDGKTPPAFQLNTQVLPISMKNLSAVYVVFIIQTPTHTYSLASVKSYALSSNTVFTPQALGTWNEVNVTGDMLADPTAGIRGISNSTADPASIIFNGTGTYHLTLQIQGACSDNPANPVGYGPCTSEPSLSLLVGPPGLHFIGGAYGLLGTDNYGRDVWSEFVWGSQISLLIGVLASVGAVGIGTIVGVAGGYLGGLMDEVVGRITDFVLVLPFLPLLIILVFIITSNPVLRSGVYVWIIIIFVVVSWPTVGKIIRSQVLSVKERSYVEASRAVGSGTWHILGRHILPNVMGLVYSQMALSVSGFIITEAALDFLSIAIHPITTMTWGIMLTQALPDATTNSTAGFVWWWFLPPGIAIAALSLAFVLVGFALDSVFNPRLRAR
jgi:ABC-type dipeptide/oligopeptide/nickel transport system permease subunit